MTQTSDEADEAHAPSSPASDHSDREGWLAWIEEIGEDAGYFQTIGKRHWAFFSDESPVLLVTFETAEAIRTRHEGLPMGHALATARGWSHLCVIAEGETWYRDPAVYGYFDRLVDDAFFEDFDRVVFFGAGMGGYAACAFSVAAPGATVLAVQPVATLDPAMTGWDHRHDRHRRLTFTDRYGYAPDMTEGAGDVYIVFDPAQPLDAMHAALFARPHVRLLRAPLLGPDTEQALVSMQVLPQLVAAAGEGALSSALFHALFRKRRRYGPYLAALLASAEAANRPRRAGLVARNVSSRMNAPRFRKKLEELTAQGIKLPPPIRPGSP